MIMTKEEKDLLLKDLSARLSYKVIVEFVSYKDEEKPWFGELSCKDLDCFMHDVGFVEIKPYLFPLSSMTEEECEEYRNIDNLSYSCPINYAHIAASRRIDWLNINHFDYRGLIEKGLAIDASGLNIYD